MGGPFGLSIPIIDTPEKVRAALARIEEVRAKYFRVMARFKGGLRGAMRLSNDDLVEGAKLGMVEKMYESGAATFRKQLAAQSQAREQGLSKEIVLKGFGTGTRGKEESLVFLQLDLDAFKLRTASCNEVLYDNLGLTFY